MLKPYLSVRVFLNQTIPTIFANSDGTTYTYESFETMNGTPFTADDIDPVRSSIISTNDPSYQVTIYRGIRTFGADISTVTFNENAFSFQAAPNPDCGEGVEFLLGSLSFTNGWWGGRPDTPFFYIHDISEFDKLSGWCFAGIQWYYPARGQSR